MRVGICTGGGDCPGLNAVIRAVVRHGVRHLGFEMIGIQESISGILADPPKGVPLSLDSTTGIFDRGGTILGTSNRGSPFKDPSQREEMFKCFASGWKKLGLDALIVVGGDGTQHIAKQLCERGFPIVGIPKTIDNDFSPTQLSIGFMTAVNVAAESIRRLHSTAESHSRYMVVEVMGRDAGFIALYAGIASGAHVILIPEIPFKYEAILKKVQERRSRGRNFGIIVAAEGAHEDGTPPLFTQSATGSVNLGGIAQAVATHLHKQGGIDTRVTVLGHIQRGGDPTPMDIILATSLGVHAANLVARKEFGRIASIVSGSVESVSYSSLASTTWCLTADNPLLRSAEAIGVSLGKSTPWQLPT